MAPKYFAALFLLLLSSVVFANEVAPGGQVLAWVHWYDDDVDLPVNHEVTCNVLAVNGDQLTLKRAGFFGLLSEPFTRSRSCVTKLGAEDSSEMAPTTASLLKEKPQAPDALAEAQFVAPSSCNTSKEAN
jgi:hypothetical protein